AVVLLIRYGFTAGLVAVLLAMTSNRGVPAVWPKGTDIWWMIGASVIICAADLLVVSAYVTARRQGAEYLYAIVAVSVLSPVLASVIKFLLTRRAPNAYYVAAYGAAAVMLILISLGSR